MSLSFIKQINDYVIESLMEASDQDILSLVNSPNYPTREDITTTSELIQKAIREDKSRRLEQRKAEFAAYKASQEIKEETSDKSIASMISDIVAAMQNKDNVPEGLLLAFREQQESASDDDIKTIWHSMVELGLIDRDDND